ncbi:MAG: pyridoxal-phosphate dependent enzyme, partial [Campylobacteraceae bacterium]
MKIIENYADLIGNTPLVKLNKISKETGTTFLAKAELLNPSGSVKDRISKAMIEDGFAKKLINKDSVI